MSATLFFRRSHASLLMNATSSSKLSLTNTNMNSPLIEQVTWSQIEHWLIKLSASSIGFDTILCVARAGIPLGVALSYLHSRSNLLFAIRHDMRGGKPPRYDFAVTSMKRRELTVSSFAIPEQIRFSTSVLVVDDVVTTGATMSGIVELIRRENSNCTINIAAYAADIVRLRHNHPEIENRLTNSMTIDNEKTWLSFPWNIEPV